MATSEGELWAREIMKTRTRSGLARGGSRHSTLCAAGVWLLLAACCELPGAGHAGGAGCMGRREGMEQRAEMGRDGTQWDAMAAMAERWLVSCMCLRLLHSCTNTAGPHCTSASLSSALVVRPILPILGRWWPDPAWAIYRRLILQYLPRRWAPLRALAPGFGERDEQ